MWGLQQIHNPDYEETAADLYGNKQFNSHGQLNIPNGLTPLKLLTY